MTIQDVHQVRSLAAAVRSAVAPVLRGKDDVVDLALTALLSEGHLLLEDVPGTGKTTLARALARALGGSFARVQFTPDLLPSDITGTSVFDARSGDFTFRTGPVFANIVLADEINRASPKTQSALLEVMAERQVTADGEARAVPRPFLVIATQNPVDADGTYPLPDAQLDRFALRLSIGYPDPDAEVEMLAGLDASRDEVERVVEPDALAAAITAVARVHASDELCRYVVDLVTATRNHPDLRLGASPRAAGALLRAARARAAITGRDFVTPDDVKTLAPAALVHRLTPTTAAAVAGRTGEAVVRDVLTAVEMPTSRALVAS